MVPQLSGFRLAHKAQLLIIVVAALITSGCITSGAATTDNEDIFAAYSIDEILQAGNEAFDRGETERAVFIYMQALEIEQNAETWYRIGLGKARLGDKAYAWEALKQSIKLDPNHAGSLEELGLINLAMGQPEQAELFLARATEIDPTRWRAWNARGVIADIDHRYDEAVLLYQSGLIGTPNSSLLLNNIGYSYYLAGNLQEATVWFGRSIMATPNYEPAIKNLALLYARQGWYDEAVKTFSKVVGKPQAYNDTGYIAFRNGDYDRASELISEAIRLAPTYYEKAYENLELVKEELRKQGKKVADANELGNVSEVIFPDGKEREYQSVMPGTLNVRAGPSPDSKIVNYLKTGDKVEVIMTLPGWAFVNYRPSRPGSNLTGWINSNYLSGNAEAKEKSGSQMAATQARKKTAQQPVAKTKVPVKTVAAPIDTTASETLGLTQDSPESDAATVQPMASATASAGATVNTGLDPASVIKSIDAVCDLGDTDNQTEKTPLKAGSCIGVASADADE